MRTHTFLIFQQFYYSSVFTHSYDNIRRKMVASPVIYSVSNIRWIRNDNLPSEKNFTQYSEIKDNSFIRRVITGNNPVNPGRRFRLFQFLYSHFQYTAVLQKQPYPFYTRKTHEFIQK